MSTFAWLSPSLGRGCDLVKFYSRYRKSEISKLYIIATFLRLVDNNGQFRVPTVFVTNAGNTLRKKKADQLSTWLGVEIEEDQVLFFCLRLGLDRIK